MRPLLLLPALLAGCSLTPALTEREDPEAVIREVFETRISRANAPTEDRQVLAIDPSGIRYRERGQERALRFRDVAIVEREVPRDAERELEVIRLYLKKNSPSITSAAPTGSVLDFRQPHILLDRRPLGSLDRLKGALEQMSARRAPPPKEPPPSIKPAPDKPAAEPSPAAEPTAAPEPTADGDPLKILEEKLRVLKRWLAEGLIDQDEYEAKKRELLKQM